MLLGYARAPLDDCEIQAQLEHLSTAGCSEIFVDRSASPDDPRPNLAKLLKVATSGDVVVVWKLDRIAASALHLTSLIEDFAARSVGFRALSEEVDTTGPYGPAISQVFKALARMERSLSDERSTARLTSTQSRRLRLGRGKPASLTKEMLFSAIEMLADKRLPGKEVAAQLGVTSANLYSYVDPKGIPREKGRRLLALKR